MMKVVGCLLFLSLVLGGIQAEYSRVSLGDQFLRAYTVYDPMPLTAADATQQGWHNQSKSCDPFLGYMFSYDASGATADHPLVLFYTAGGQLAGSQVWIYDKKGDIMKNEANLVNRGFIEKAPGGSTTTYTITLSYRDSSMVCSSETNSQILGDRLVINPATLYYPLPVTEEEAISANFTKGSCFYGMGYHYFYDLATAPEMSWSSENLLPVVLMFNRSGHIQASFYTVASKQQATFDSHWWEPIALPNSFMCKNWCDSSCSFPGVSWWSTMHTYFNDIDDATCEDNCQQGCCP